MAAPIASVSQVVRFGVFEVDTQAGELRRNGAKVKVEGQSFTVLRLLLERPGQLVTREELKEKLWPADTFVDFEHSINVAVKRLRDALQDSATAPRYIETLPKRGYRFVYPLNGGATALPQAPGRATRRWWMAVAALVVLLAIAGALIPSVRGRLLNRPAPGTIKRVAVLPFRASASDPDQAELAFGFTEMVITELGRLVPGVVSHQSVLQYAHSDKSATQIAEDLNVDCVVEGTVARFGNSVRVTVNVIVFDPEEEHRYAAPFVGDLKDVMGMESDVAKMVATEIRAPIPPAERQRPRPRPVSRQVADALHYGLAYYKKGTDTDRERAAEYFAKAVELDPDCAQAYAYFAMLNAHGGAARQGGGPANRLKAREAAEKALRLDEGLAEAHAAKAWLELSDRNWQAAEREFKRAIELNPSLPNARTWYAQFLAAQGRGEEAAAQAAVVLGLDVDPNNVTHAAWALLAVGRVDEAITRLRATIALAPDYIWAHRFLGEAYLRKGIYQEAIAELGSEPGRKANSLGLLAYAYSRAGQQTEAVKIVRGLETQLRQARAQDKWLPLNVMVPAYLAVGEKEKALSYLEAALDRPAQGLVFLNAEECYRPLRSEPRFQDLVRKVGIPAVH